MTTKIETRLEEMEKRYTQDDFEITPEICEQCGATLLDGKGMVGESLLYCPEHGIKWVDHEEAMRIIM